MKEKEKKNSINDSWKSFHLSSLSTKKKVYISFSIENFALSFSQL